MCSCKGQAEEGSKEEDFGERNKDTGGQRCMVQTFLNFSPGGIELGNPDISGWGRKFLEQKKQLLGFPWNRQEETIKTHREIHHPGSCS